jgi:hypothetical protein
MDDVTLDRVVIAQFGSFLFCSLPIASFSTKKKFCTASLHLLAQ